MVAPSPPKVSLPSCVMGCSSSKPQACSSYALQECAAASLIERRFLSKPVALKSSVGRSCCQGKLHC